MTNAGTSITPEEGTVVLRMVAEGVPSTWIAERIGVSPDTMDHFLRNRPEGKLAAKNGREYNRVWTSIRPSDRLRKWHNQFAPRRTR